MQYHIDPKHPKATELEITQKCDKKTYKEVIQTNAQELNQTSKPTEIKKKPTERTNKCTDWSRHNRGVDHSHKVFVDPLEHELLINGFLKNRTKTCNRFPAHRVDEGK
jgi:hypothetical protein